MNNKAFLQKEIFMPRILIVDQRDYRDTDADKLLRAGHRVSDVKTAEEALQQIQIAQSSRDPRQTFSLILAHQNEVAGQILAGLENKGVNTPIMVTTDLPKDLDTLPEAIALKAIRPGLRSPASQAVPRAELT
jgi:CheY-like chemotaxis protein